MNNLGNMGAFVRFPVITTKQDEEGNTIQDHFVMNIMHDSVVGVSEMDPNEKVPNGKSIVYLNQETGLRAIVSEATSGEIMDILDVMFVALNVVSVSDHTDPNKRTVGRYQLFADPETIVGLNAVDPDVEQVSKDVRAVVYFQPKSGLRPVLTTNDADQIIESVNYCFFGGSG